MRIEKVVLAVFTAAGVWSWDTRCDAASAAVFRLCGRNLSEFMSRVCHAYNSPAWDDPRVVEQPAAVVRRRRQIGIADECCDIGCSWEQLMEYCAVSTNSESSLHLLEAHMIADRSAEGGGAASEPAGVKNVARAAPVVGTVSPLLTWGRTIHADLPPEEHDRYAYIAVYETS